MAATALRQLFVNWYSKSLQISDRNGGIFTLPPFNKYEVVPFKVVIVEPDLSGAGISRFTRCSVANFSLKVSINDSLDTATPMVSQNTWTKDTINNSMSAELNLNTAALNAYIGSSTSKTAYFAIELTDGTAITQIFTTQITLSNTLAQVGSAAPAPSDTYYTAAVSDARFVTYNLPAGAQITFKSPDGLTTRTLGIDNGGNVIDQVLQ